MVETKPFKTKLCLLYQRGRCGRQTCTFAHGDSELRRYSGSFADKQNNRDNDLRNKLRRKRSPLHRYSPARDSRDSHASKRYSPRPIRRKSTTHEHTDGQSDFSGSFKIPDGTVDCGKDRKLVLSDSRNMLEDQIKQVQCEVDLLLDQKGQLEIELEEGLQEANILSSRIRDLEAQLSGEKDKSKRVNSKMKKLIRAHVHHSRMQDEIKRAQVQLEQLVEELGIDDTQFGASEDNLNVNIISDEEIPELKDRTSPVKRLLESSMEVPQGSKSADMVKVQGARVVGSWRNSLVGGNGNREAKVGNKRKDTLQPSNESKPHRQKNASKSSDHLDKLKISESNLMVPPTSMAAHAVDDLIELAEAEETPGVVGRPTTVQNGLPFPLPPVPSVSQNSYFQYVGDDENVDVDGLEEEFEEVDIV